MKKKMILRLVSFVVCCGLLSGFTGSYVEQSDRSKFSESDQLLTMVYSKLEHFNAVQYDYLLELNYFSENYSRNLTGTAFVEFTPSDSVIGFKYQMGDGALKWVYNGTESFALDKGQKTLSVNTSPAFKDFVNLTPFYNSLVTFRKALPAVIADKDIIKSVSDTSMAQGVFHLVKLKLNRRTIERLGGFSELSTDRQIIYDLIIDKKTYLPVQVIQRNSTNNDFARTVFSNVITNPAKPSELSWYYSSYANDFATKHAKALKPLAPDALAPNWELPLFGSNESIKLSQLKGTVILLEFWNKNCGYCISAVPKLNRINERFKQDRFMVLGVNTHDKRDEIVNFYQRTNPNYKTLLKGNRVAEEYGIGFYPLVVLIDRQGKVLYTGGIDEMAIGNLIQSALVSD